MTQVTLKKDGISVDDRIYSAGEVVAVPDDRAFAMVEAGEADYAVEKNAADVPRTNATHPVTDQGNALDPETGKMKDAKPTTGPGNTGVLNSQAPRENAAVPGKQPAQPSSK
jgi:hypothetical protein